MDDDVDDDDKLTFYTTLHYRESSGDGFLDQLDISEAD